MTKAVMFGRPNIFFYMQTWRIIKLVQVSKMFHIAHEMDMKTGQSFKITV